MTTFHFPLSRLLFSGMLMFAASSLFSLAQEPAPVEAPRSSASVTSTPLAPTAHKLQTFNLDFPGGTPGQLIEAIFQASGRPVNAIIPSDLANVLLPPLKMREVDLPHLFVALTAAFQRQEVRNGGFIGESRAGFMSQDQNAENAIWYFFQTRPPPTPTACRFYSLSPFLDAGFTVDDLTTAIQTGWRMLQSEKPGTMSFHKETKLLIVVGNGEQLEVVAGALFALQPRTTRTDPVQPKDSKTTVAPGEKK